jgi:hypothetical protein
MRGVSAGIFEDEIKFSLWFSFRRQRVQGKVGQVEAEILSHCKVSSFDVEGR